MNVDKKFQAWYNYCMTRFCKTCAIEKSIEEFNFRNRQKNIRHTQCKNCTRANNKRIYYANVRYYLDKNKRRVRELMAFVNQYKQKPCMDCGVQYPSYVMDFDHRDSEDKVGEISLMAINRGFSKERILAEIKKCDLVCSNCHRERTHQRILQSSVTGSIADSESVDLGS